MINTAFAKVQICKPRFLKCEETYTATEINTSAKDKKKKQSNSTRSRLYVPLIKTTTHIMMSIFQTSFMSKKCPIDMDRVGEREGDRDIRNAVMSVVKQYWEQSSHRVGLSKAVLSAISLPLGTAALWWDSVEDMPNTRFVRITDIAFDPDATSINDIEYVCYRSKISMRDVRANFDKGLYKLTKGESDFGEHLKNNERVIKDEIYTKGYSKERGTFWELTTFINNKVVREKVGFKMLPFHSGYLIEKLPSISLDIDDEDEMESQIYGLAVPELLYELQKEYNIKRNQKIDIVEKMIDPTRTVDASAGAVSLADIKNGEKFIRVRTDGRKVSDVMSVDYVPSPYPLSEEIELIRREYETTSGVNSIMLGQTSPSDRRAMGALQTVNASSSMRIESMMQTLVDTFLNGYAQHFVYLVYNNAPDEVFAKITENPEILNIIGPRGSRKPIEFDVRVNFGTIIGDEVKLSKLTQLLGILMQSGVTNVVVVEKLLQDILTLIQGENAALEEIELPKQEPPPPPSKEEVDRESMVNGGL
jgi:hypothetical protein